jgi:transcriptional regulator with XRE-family HTH domain
MVSEAGARVAKSAFTERYELFRNLLIEARKNADLTQAELAAKLRLPQSFVSKYERGERRLDVVEFIRVAELLSVDPHTIIDRLTGSPATSTRARNPKR